MTEIQCRPGGTAKWTKDLNLNDSDKSFTVPTGKRWMLKEVFVNFVSTATVGNRFIRVSFTDGVNEIGRGVDTAVQTASLDRFYTWATTGTYASALASGYIGPIPELILPSGYVVRVFDIAAIDAAADDMTVVLHYIEYEA